MAELIPPSFGILHEIILKTLESKGIDCSELFELKKIGNWFYKFCLFDVNSLSLKVPNYNSETISVVVDYIVYLDLLIKIANSQPVVDFEGTALFDIIEYRSANSYNRRHGDFSCEFKEKKDDVLVFDRDIVVSSQRFLPLFRSGTVNGKFREAIADAFYLFVALAKHRVINTPVLLDIERDLTLLISESYKLDGSKLLLDTFQAAEIIDDDHRESVFKHYETKDISKTFILKYPYHCNISSIITEELSQSSKTFEICFRSRFYYDEIRDNDVFLTPSEVLKDEVDDCSFFPLNSFYVIETDHQKGLVDRLREFKETWLSTISSSFRQPFPIKWFMCVHGEEALGFWIERFRLDYPSIAYSLVEESIGIIKEIYNLNWIDKCLERDSDRVIILPKSNVFPEIIESLKKHLIGRYKAVLEADIIFLKTPIADKVWIFDPFNSILLSNLLPLCSMEIRAIVPDFLYFSCYPYIKYHISNYYYSALLYGGRHWGDSRFSKNSFSWNEKKKTIIHGIKEEIRIYNSRHQINNPKALDSEDLRTDNTSSHDYLEEEVIEIYNEKGEVKELRNVNLIFRVTEDRIFTLRPKSTVLLEDQGYLLKTQAQFLRAGMKFIPMDEIKNAIEVSQLIDNITSLSESVLGWKFNLNKIREKDPNLFKRLKNRGLSIRESTFVNDYLSDRINSTNFSLPRSKNDWEIICKELSILDMREAWISHKCNGDLLKLKKAYIDIISYLHSNLSFGANIEDQTLAAVDDILRETINADESHEESRKDARAVILAINKQIKLFTIKEIVTNSYEPND